VITLLEVTVLSIELYLITIIGRFLHEVQTSLFVMPRFSIIQMQCPILGLICETRASRQAIAAEQKYPALHCCMLEDMEGQLPFCRLRLPSLHLIFSRVLRRSFVFCHRISSLDFSHKCLHIKFFRRRGVTKTLAPQWFKLCSDSCVTPVRISGPHCFENRSPSDYLSARSD